jgi:hypothetical protein
MVAGCAVLRTPHSVARPDRRARLLALRRIGARTGVRRPRGRVPRSRCGCVPRPRSGCGSRPRLRWQPRSRCGHVRALRCGCVPGSRCGCGSRARLRWQPRSRCGHVPALRCGCVPGSRRGHVPALRCGCVPGVAVRLRPTWRLRLRPTSRRLPHCLGPRGPSAAGAQMGEHGPPRRFAAPPVRKWLPGTV